MSFDLKKDAWYIRVNSPEESRAVQEWLFEQGLDWPAGRQRVIEHRLMAYLANCSKGDTAQEFLVFGINPSCVGGVDDIRREITVCFENTLRVDYVVFPEKKETVEIGGKMYYKDDVEKALSLLKPMED